LIAHVTILGIWLLLWLVFFGWGVAACFISRCDRDDGDALLINPWIGMGVTIGILQIWQLFAPVNSTACWIICSVGVFAAACCFRRLSLIWMYARQWPGLALATALLALWFANRSLHVLIYTDHGLYYLNSIRWDSEYPIVPGLANLHNRFGFNNSFFLLHAMVEHIIGRGYSGHVINGLLATMAIPIFFRGFRSAFYGSINERIGGWFVLAMAAVVATGISDFRIYSATPDFPAAMLVTIAIWRLLVLVGTESELQDPSLRWNLLSIAVLAGAAVVVKTLSIFLAGFAAIVLVIVIYWLHRGRSAQPLGATARSIAFVMVWALFLFAPWVLRGYILSGYPLFPATFAGAPVNWKVEEQSGAELRELMLVWYRTLHVQRGYLPGLRWIPEWALEIALLRAPFELVVPAAIALLSSFWLAYCWLRRSAANSLPNKTSPPETRSGSLATFAAWLLVPAYLGAITLWFITAPSPRLGTFALWGIAGVLVGLASRTSLGDWANRHRRWIIAALLALMVMPMVDRAIRVEFLYRKNRLLPEFGSHFYKYYPFDLDAIQHGFPPLPQGDLEKRTTDSGLVVYVAKPGSDGIPGLLWDSPLPAARFFNPGLELRRSDDLRGGFKTVPFQKNPWMAGEF
jgi:hypothetical protein